MRCTPTPVAREVGRLVVARTSLCVCVCSCVGLGLGLGNRVRLGIGFREWVPIRNIIGGAAGAHIPMTFALQLSACPAA